MGVECAAQNQTQTTMTTTFQNPNSLDIPIIL